jgi:hypothetical protein
MACKGCAERRAWIKARASNAKSAVVALTTRDKLLAKQHKKQKPLVV